MLVDFTQTITVKKQNIGATNTQQVVFGRKATNATIDIKCHVAPMRSNNMQLSDVLHSKNIYLVHAPLESLPDIIQGSTCIYEGSEFVISTKPVAYRNILPHIEFRITELSGD